MNRLRLSTLSLTLAIAVMTLGYANPSFADKPNNGMHDGHGDDDGDDAVYKVEFTTGLVVGESDDDFPWRGDFGGKKTIGLNDASEGREPGVFTDLSGLVFSVNEFFGGGEGTTCFPDDADFTIHQGSVSQGRGGRAQAGFFFHGLTFEGNETVLYGLLLTGDFVSGPWPPTINNPAILDMTDWELKVENEGKAIKSISCQGDGDGPPVTIKVTLET